DAGGARVFLARCADRDGSQSALRRTGDNGDTHLRPPYGMAELDLPATERGGRGRLAEALWQRTTAKLRCGENMSRTCADGRVKPGHDGWSGLTLGLARPRRLARSA